MAYDLIPVRSLLSLASANVRPDTFDPIFGNSDHPAVYVYARASGPGNLRYRARMFWPGPDGNLAEDPATASGAAALVGVIIEQENLADGDHTVTVEQGVEMGRPSTITLYLSIRDGALVTLNVSGEVVLVSRGELNI